MTNKTKDFNEQEVLQHLRHYLPSQAPLKDFIHHNTLHAFQNADFFDALKSASAIFGYKTRLSLEEYRQRYSSGLISPEALEEAIRNRTGTKTAGQWQHLLLHELSTPAVTPRIGKLRGEFRRLFKINFDKEVHPLLFRLLSNFLDQGISVRPFPVEHKPFLTSVREIIRNSAAPIFRGKRAEHLLMHTHSRLEDLLGMLIGDDRLFEQYLFDQQFSHPGWSGMVAVIEQNPAALLDRRVISLHDLIYLELLLEIDALDSKYGSEWPPLANLISEHPEELFADVPSTDYHEGLAIWQEAMEWTYYRDVLSGLTTATTGKPSGTATSFDALFCIDDRECSLRRHVEMTDPQSRTWGTPGFFNVACYFQPGHSRHYTKICPAPLQATHLIREQHTRKRLDADAHFTKHSNSVVFGWMISQTLGFWSALKLFLNIFKPGISPATSYSFNHMDQHAKLTIECKHPEERVHGMQVGFTISEMADIVEGLLKGIGLTEDPAPLVYVVGHGASSVNNTHYAGYDCGACSGRPGSVNARAASFMANHSKVRELLSARGIRISPATRFIGALHDTTRDEIMFYDEDEIPDNLRPLHEQNARTFRKALELNAKERSRRFEFINTCQDSAALHEKVKLRSVSLFEPRPELNHATNALCIVGRRELTDHLFLDRRAFLNSYDYRSDENGTYLAGILRAVTPVCGGINLEYYFSRVDNQRLGAGTKLPHNVMGLIGVANGADGDLRTGLPWQMVEVHDPLRLLMVIEQKPDIVEQILKKDAATLNWYRNNWINLVVVHPENRTLFRFQHDSFSLMENPGSNLPVCHDIQSLLEKESGNINVHLIKQAV